MKIVVLDGYTLNPGDLSWGAMEEIAPVTVYDRTRPEEIIPRIGGAELVFTNKTPLTEETFAACPSIRFVGVLATGYNIVDIQAAGKRWRSTRWRCCWSCAIISGSTIVLSSVVTGRRAWIFAMQTIR